MKSYPRAILLLALLPLVFPSTVLGQTTGWNYRYPMSISENKAEAGTDYVMSLDIDTEVYVEANRMQADGDDIRFFVDAARTEEIPYWIESGMNTASTRIWLRLPQLDANTDNLIHLFTGNTAATAGSSFSSVFVDILIISSDTSMPVEDYSYDWFEVESGATLTLTGNGRNFQVSGGKIVVSGTIDGDGAGYSGGDQGAGGGPGGGSFPSRYPEGAGAGGGGHGGAGGDGGMGGGHVGDPYAPGGVAYGDAADLAINPGSGGGSHHPLLAGGGAGIHLKAHEIVLDTANIRANGEAGGRGDMLPGSGGGAGGGIMLHGERVIINNASLSASGGIGGKGSGFDDGGGGGGGGYIKVFQYQDHDDNNIQGLATAVSGGRGGADAGGDGAPGWTLSSQDSSKAFSYTTGTEVHIHDLVYIAGANGTITGSASQTVASGENGGTVTAVASTGYHFASWNDGSLDNPRRDTFVVEDLTVTAFFAIDQYTLIYDAGANGTLTGTTTQTVDPGDESSAVTAVPATGYHFVQWSDGSTDNPRTDDDFTADLTVTAQFAINQYTLTYLAGDNGTLTGASAQTVDHNAAGTEIQAVPDRGYRFVQWSDGASTNPRVDLDVTAALTVTAEFTRIPEDPTISGYYRNFSLLTDALIMAGAILEGGRLSGDIDNQGVIRNVILLPGTTIVGGTLEGSITGDPSSPALLNSRIAAGTFLSHVILGVETLLEADVIFGPGVRFQSLSVIPHGMLLSGLLESFPPGGLPPPLAALDLRHSLTSSEDGLTVLESLVLPPFLQQAPVFQDPDTGLVTVRGSGFRSTFLPVAIQQGAEGSAPISADGDIALMTHDGQQVLGYPMPGDVEALRRALAAMGLRLSFDARANLIVSSAALDTGDQRPWYIGRADAVAVPAAPGATPGLHFRPRAAPLNTAGLVLVYEDGGELFEQAIVPVPADWEAFERGLREVLGATNVRVDARGLISVTIGDQTFEGMADYVVVPASAGGGNVEFELVDDLNGDGVSDLRMRVTNAMGTVTQQIFLLR